MIPINSTAQNAARVLLGGMLVLAGTGHLTFLREDFQAQVPDFVPLEKDDTVLYSGVLEIALGTALVLSPAGSRKLIGEIAAGFFAAVFPGNIAQYVHKRSAFGYQREKTGAFIFPAGADVLGAEKYETQTRLI